MIGSFTPLGTSLAFPPRPDGNGGLALVSGPDAVADHLRAIIETIRGSHAMEPWFGVPMLPFRPVSHAAAIAELIKRAIIAAEDRIDPEHLVVSAGTTGLDQGLLPIKVAYLIKGEASERTLAHGYRAIRQ